MTMATIKNSRLLFISTPYFKGNIPYWCSTDKPIGRNLTLLPWAGNEPDNGYPPESVFVFYYMNDAFGIGDGNSMMPWQYICQWP